MTKPSATLELTDKQLKQLRDHDWFPHDGGAWIELRVEDFENNLDFEEICGTFMRKDFVKNTVKLKLCIVGWNAE